VQKYSIPVSKYLTLPYILDHLDFLSLKVFVHPAHAPVYKSLSLIPVPVFVINVSGLGLNIVKKMKKAGSSMFLASPSAPGKLVAPIPACSLASSSAPGKLVAPVYS